MPAFGAVLGLSSHALFFVVITEKTDKSQRWLDVESHTRQDKAHRLNIPALRFAIGRATCPTLLR